jgi:hypothetical protein
MIVNHHLVESWNDLPTVQNLNHLNAILRILFPLSPVFFQSPNRTPAPIIFYFNYRKRLVVLKNQCVKPAILMSNFKQNRDSVLATKQVELRLNVRLRHTTTAYYLRVTYLHFPQKKTPHGAGRQVLQIPSELRQRISPVPAP